MSLPEELPADALDRRIDRHEDERIGRVRDRRGERHVRQQSGVEQGVSHRACRTGQRGEERIRGPRIATCQTAGPGIVGREPHGVQSAAVAPDNRRNLVRAAVCTRYGPPDVLQLREVETPVPRDDEVLVKIRATTVTSSDWFVRSGGPTLPLVKRAMMHLVVGIRGPRRAILGMVLAGEVDQVGREVRRFRVGDRVYAFTKYHFGAYAQYVCLAETSTIAGAPGNVTFDEAAAIPYGGLLALHFLSKGRIASGQGVLVYGASGAVGTSAVQLARHFGADVTAVCGPSNLGLAGSLGAAEVVDYTKESAPPVGRRYDLVFDAVGRRETSALKVACSTALTPGGRYLSVDDGTPETPATALAQLTELVEAGSLRPVIDRLYPLELIAEAHRYVEGEHKKGSVVITVGHEGD